MGVSPVWLKTRDRVEKSSWWPSFLKILREIIERYTEYKRV
jgi:hypothetical protein